MAVLVSELLGVTVTEEDAVELPEVDHEGVIVNENVGDFETLAEVVWLADKESECDALLLHELVNDDVPDSDVDVDAVSVRLGDNESEIERELDGVALREIEIVSLIE